MDDKPADFDWVEQRAKCSAFAMFKELERQAQANVERRESGLTDRERQWVAFKFEAQRNYFAVIADNQDRIVRFGLKGEQIAITGDGIAVDLTVTLTLNHAGDCRLKVNGEGEFQPWQVLRTALESLFFDLQRSH